MRTKRLVKTQLVTLVAVTLVLGGCGGGGGGGDTGGGTTQSAMPPAVNSGCTGPTITGMRVSSTSGLGMTLAAGMADISDPLTNAWASPPLSSVPFVGSGVTGANGWAYWLITWQPTINPGGMSFTHTALVPTPSGVSQTAFVDCLDIRELTPDAMGGPFIGPSILGTMPTRDPTTFAQTTVYNAPENAGLGSLWLICVHTTMPGQLVQFTVAP